MDNEADYKKMIHELIEDIDSQWMLWKLYRLIINITR